LRARQRSSLGSIIMFFPSSWRQLGHVNTLALKEPCKHGRQMLCVQTVVIGLNTISWQQMHKNLSSTLDTNFY
jgi:hypothetical protein